jgi:TRAP-type C4-dicarboxylate transport system permease large subunit
MASKLMYFALIAFVIFCLFFFSNFMSNNYTVKNVYVKYLGVTKDNYRALDDLFKELFDTSVEQSFIEPYVLLKTLQFWIMDVDQYDQKLIQFIKTLIHKPSTQSLN